MAKNVGQKKLTTQQKRDLNVEIRFLEELAIRTPEWVDLLKLLGDDYTRAGHILEGLGVDERLAKLCPEDPSVFYNLACSFSLAERYEPAIAALDRAIQLGYKDFKWLTSDPDMANLRKHPLFQSFRSKLGQKKC